MLIRPKLTSLSVDLSSTLVGLNCDHYKYVLRLLMYLGSQDVSGSRENVI